MSLLNGLQLFPLFLCFPLNPLPAPQAAGCTIQSAVRHQENNFIDFSTTIPLCQSGPALPYGFVKPSILVPALSHIDHAEVQALTRFTITGLPNRISCCCPGTQGHSSQLLKSCFLKMLYIGYLINHRAVSQFVDSLQLLLSNWHSASIMSLLFVSIFRASIVVLRSQPDSFCVEGLPFSSHPDSWEAI